MIQRYAILAVVLVALGYGLYYQIQRNGRLMADNATLTASVEFMNRQRVVVDKAQEAARKGREAAERDANLARLELVALRRKYAELLDRPLPAELVERLRLRTSNRGDMPTGQPAR